MELSTLLGYLSTLALLYAWTLIAAGIFSVGERIAQRTRR
jgi:hypothetical protein